MIQFSNIKDHQLVIKVAERPTDKLPASFECGMPIPTLISHNGFEEPDWLVLSNDAISNDVVKSFVWVPRDLCA